MADPFDPAPVPVPIGAEYLGTLDDLMYYKYHGAVWAWTPTAWYGVCLISDWSTRPAAVALAAQTYASPLVQERAV